MAKFDYRKVKAEVHEFCSMADFNTYDEAGIVSALRNLADTNGFCITSIDDVDADTWEHLLDKFDTNTITAIAW